MAKKLVYNYTFDASAKTIKIYDNISVKKLLLITNVTDNVIIYNFADETKGASNVVFDPVTEHTEITLDFDTTSMSDSDQLQIFIEKSEIAFEPSETFVDPVSKIRVSNPENLVDTDFEYGPQASKWETLQLVNNIPSAYSNTSDTTISGIISIFATTGSDVINVTTKFEHNLTAGTPIDVRGLTSFTAEGSYLIQSVPTPTTFTYRCRGTQSVTGNLSGAYSSVIPGQFYSNSQLVLDSYNGLLADSRNYIVEVPGGTNGGFHIDSVQSPDLTITKNGIFYFTQDIASNTGHRIKFARTDKFVSEFLKNYHQRILTPAEGSPSIFATNNTTVNLFVTDNGHVYTSDTDIERVGSQWLETTYVDSAGSLNNADGKVFNKGLYAESLGLQIRVGNGGLIATSPDNLNWTVQTTPNSEDLFDVDWDGAFFTVVGNNGTVIRSADGVSWSQVAGTVGTTNYKGVQSNSQDLVIVGALGEIRSSADGGANFTLQTTSGTENLEAAAWSGQKWLVVGAGGIVYSSPDSVTWTAEGGVGSSNNLTEVIWDSYDNQFVIIGASGTLLTSADGTTFVTRATGLSNTLVGVDSGDAGNGHRIVIIDGQGDGAFSEDAGVNWTAFTTGTGVSTTECYWTGYTFNIFQHTGSGGSELSNYYSAIQQPYTQIPAAQVGFGAGGVLTPRDVIWVTSDNQFVMVGDQNAGAGNGAIFVSTSGSAWTEKADANIPDESFKKVVYNTQDSNYYFLTEDNLHKTADGTTFATWTQLLDKSSITTSSGFATDTIVNGGSAYNAGTNIPLITLTGDGSGAQATVQVVGGVVSDVTITTAGKDYKQGDRVQISGGNGDAILEVATLGNGSNSTTAVFKDLYVSNTNIAIVGTGGTVVWSSDGGATFEVDNVGDSVQLNSIAIDNTYANQYIAVGNALSGAYITTSTDLETWTRIPTSNIPVTGNLNKVIFDGERYIAAGADGSVITSYDGTHWMKVSLYGVTNNISDIASFTNTNAITGAGTYIAALVDQTGTPDNEQSGIWIAEEGLVEYTDGVYYTQQAPGSAESYTRIFVDSNTPKYLTYYCQTHGLTMKGNVYFDELAVSKIYMMTEHENGFSTGTDFYVVNTVSPKVVEVVDPTLTAPDGRPYVDTQQTISINALDTRALPLATATTQGYDAPEQTGNQLMGYKGSYELQITPDSVDYNTNTFTFDEDHKLYDGAALYYYPMPGDKPIGGLARSQVYYVQVVNSKSIRLHNAGSTPFYFNAGVKVDKMSDWDYPVTLSEWSFTGMRAQQSAEYTWQNVDDARYGCSHAISKDGYTCAVGARYSDVSRSNGGYVFIYQKNPYNGEWEYKQRFEAYASTTTTVYFGTSVALNADGTRLLVGMPDSNRAGTDVGSLYVYDREKPFSGMTNSTDYANYWEGSYVSFYGAYVFETNDITSIDNDTDSYMGQSCDINDLGDWFVTGIPFNDEGGGQSGDVVVSFQTTFNTKHPRFGNGDNTLANADFDHEEVKPTDGSLSASDYFGGVVRMDGNNTKIVVSAPQDDQTVSNSGSVYIFDRGAGNTWTQAQRLNSPAPSNDGTFGNSLAFSKNAEWIAVGEPQADTSAGTNMGQVHLYQWDSGTSAFQWRQTLECPQGTTNWSEQKDSIHFGGSYINGMDPRPTEAGAGQGVCFNYDGSVLAIGAPLYDLCDKGPDTNYGGTKSYRWSNVGAVFTYRINNAKNGFDNEGKILSNYSDTSSHFGASIAMDGNGDEMAVGAPEATLRYRYTTYNGGYSEWYSRGDYGTDSSETPSAISAVSNSALTITNAVYNTLKDGDVILYYHGSGATSDGSLVSGTKYFITKAGSDQINLHDTIDEFYAGTIKALLPIGTTAGTGVRNIKKINRGATFDRGNHRFALCYRIQREEKYSDTNPDRWYYETIYHHIQGNSNTAHNGNKTADEITWGSGYDLHNYGTNSYGLAGSGGYVGTPNNVENSFIFHTYRPGRGYSRHIKRIEGTGYSQRGSNNANSERHNHGWGQYETNGACMYPQTKGVTGHRADPLLQPRSDSARRNLFGPYGTAGDNSIAPANCSLYGDDANPWTDQTTLDGRIGIRGQNREWNRNYKSDVENWDYDWAGALYWMPLAKVNDVDTFYSENHNLVTNEQLTFNVLTGEGITYNNNTGWNTSSESTLGDNTTVFVEVVDDNRFRIKTSISGQTLRMIQLPGTYSVTGTIDNPKGNSIYVEDHQLSENNKIIYTNEGTSVIGGLVDGSTYYVDIVNGDRFAVRSDTSVSFTGRAQSLATNGAPTNETRITRLSITSGLQLGMEVDLVANTQGLTQQGKYVITDVNFTTINADSNYIEVDNQWGGTATSLVSDVSFAAAVPPQQLTGTGSGQQAFEDQTSDFGVSDGGYKNTVIIDEKTLEINVPFKVRPTKKLFDTSTAVDTLNNIITITDHYFVTGQKVIYSNNGGNTIGGLTNNTDYYIIQLDDDQFKLAESRADAITGTAVPLTQVPGVPENHVLTHANVAGRVLGAGRLTTENGSRRIIGSQGDATYPDTSFKRYFKVGDVIRLLDTSTSPSTIYERLITAIKDDFEMLVDEPLTFTSNNTAQYFIDTLVYVRPDGYYLHRPFDGGMEIGSSKSPDGLICRQTRKYFRYQSGKGIQTSLAINFNPKIGASSMTYKQVTGDVYGNIRNFSFANAPGDTNWDVTGDASGSNVGVANKSGDTLNFTVANGSDNLWITTSTATSGLGANYTDNVTLNITNNGTNDGVITWDTSEAPAGTYYYISEQNPVAMRGEITITEAADGAKNRMVVVTRYPHSVQENVSIIVNDANDAEFNSGTEGWKVINVVDDFTFEVDLKTLIPSVNNATGFLGYHIKSWSNSAVRCGMFDFQNGFFFEFDGTDIYCVRRSSTQQMTGTVSVIKNSNEVTGLDTKFTSQLAFGDKVVIRGQTYKVVKVTSDTTIKIQPSYRGTTTDNVLISKTIDTRVAQGNWNIDHCDGTGETGYNLDLTKIQMAYMDYSWYGAGKIRFGFKDQNGHVKYVHEFRHNNRLTESYFRSGNLPARYEIESSGISTHTPTLFHWGTSVMMDGMFQDDDAYLFTASGQVLKYTNADAVQIDTRSGSFISSNRVSNLYEHYIVLRFGTDVTSANAAAAAAPAGTYIYNDTLTGYLAGFFSAGRPVASYKETRLFSTEYRASILFYDGNNYELSYAPYRTSRGITGLLDGALPGAGEAFFAGAPDGDVNTIDSNIPIISIRLSPSVDSSIQGLLGDREVINRMQLKLNAIDIQTTYETEIELRLNGALSSDSWYAVDSPSLSQLISHEKGDTISGGLKVFTFRAAGGTTGAAETTTLDLSKLIDLGNSIQGGDGVFPNGPDVLTIVANIIDSSNVSSSEPFTISGKISWAESQA